MDRKRCTCNQQKLCSQITNSLFGVVNQWNKRGGNGNQDTDTDMSCKGKEQQFVVGIFCFFDFASAKKLTDHNGYRITHSEHDNAEQVPNGAGDVGSSNDSQAAGGVALVDHSGTDTPQYLVGDQWSRRDQNTADNSSRNFQTLVGTDNEFKALLMCMGDIH